MLSRNRVKSNVCGALARGSLRGLENPRTPEPRTPEPQNPEPRTEYRAQSTGPRAPITEHRDTIPLSVVIRLNGEPHSVDGPLTIAELLHRLHIDPRRVAVERNLIVVKKALYGETVVDEGDEIEIVNFVGGG